ncbi:hypothetical protein EI94DRAFT_355538 [Lactarius quietus]|nr:hypothetical protein EI94DRAFT_355538 [Lactarius quietus]
MGWILPRRNQVSRVGRMDPIFSLIAWGGEAKGRWKAHTMPTIAWKSGRQSQQTRNAGRRLSEFVDGGSLTRLSAESVNDGQYPRTLSCLQRYRNSRNDYHPSCHSLQPIGDAIHSQRRGLCPEPPGHRPGCRTYHVLQEKLREKRMGISVGK